MRLVSTVVKRIGSNKVVFTFIFKRVTMVMKEELFKENIPYLGANKHRQFYFHATYCYAAIDMAYKNIYNCNYIFISCALCTRHRRRHRPYERAYEIAAKSTRTARQIPNHPSNEES